MSRKISFVVNKSEITAGTRGSSLGPEAIFTAARKEKSTFFNNYPISEIENYNHILDMPVKYSTAQRIEGLISVYKNISEKVKDVLSRNEFPFVLAGDHGSAGGTIAGVKMAYPNKRLGVIWIDAHADIHTPYTTPSGNMHGMPLATALGVDNYEMKSNVPKPEVQNFWNELKNIGGITPKLDPKDLVYIAVRDTEDQEDGIIEKLNIKNHTVAEVRSKGVDAIIAEINAQLQDCDMIYISFDVDSMDPFETSHGTGTPVKDGLTPLEAEQFLSHFASQEKTACIEFVEVNPCLDEKCNVMAEESYKLVVTTTQALEK